MNIWKDGQTDKWTERQIEEQLNSETDGHLDRLRDRKTNGQIDR